MAAPANIKAFLDLCRVGNLPTVWTNVLAACLLAGAPLPAAVFLLLAASLSSFYSAGMVLNDLCDSEHDRQARPTRPIPSGRVTVREAQVFLALLFVTGFTLLAFAPYRAGAVAAIVLLAAIVVYDLDHKKKPSTVLLMAFCRFLVFAVTALAVAGRLSPLPLLAGSVQFGYIVVLSLIARYENNLAAPLAFPVIPVMLAGISLLDGVLLALFAHPVWLVAGVGGFLLTSGGQRYFRGD
jgi:4-hydroxybenzoate polyprenyltransferase